jgi:nucleoside 2-deoxyribosyltransferase
MSKSLYLAGPIAGLSYRESTTWRRIVARKLEQDVIPLSPMRGKEYLDGNPSIKGDYDAAHRKHVLSTQAAITARDRNDVLLRSDAVLVNFLGAEKISLGTVIEVGWADAARKPIILVIEPEGNVHDYLMIRQAAGFRTDCLEEACFIANTLLSDTFAKLNQ